MKIIVQFNTIGDSHCIFSFKDIPNVQTHHIWMVTMHRIGIEKIKFKSFNVQSEGWLITCFGEIDVRWHIGKQVRDGREEEEVLDTLVYNYVEALKENLKDYPNICVMEIVPPAYSCNVSSEYGFVGTDKERARYCSGINHRLRQTCEKNNLKVLEIHEHYADSGGMLIPELSDGSIHIGDNNAVKNLLREFFLPMANWRAPRLLI